MSQYAEAHAAAHSPVTDNEQGRNICSLSETFYASHLPFGLPSAEKNKVSVRDG